MSTYRYEAVNEGGKTVSGLIEAESQDHANDLLGARGLTPISMRDETAAAVSPRWQKIVLLFNTVHPEELILYTKQLSTMLKAGIPILRVVDILENQSENPRLKDISRQIGLDIRSGTTLSRSLRRHPDVFSALYCSMVQAGETSGALPQILQRLIYIITHEYQVKTEVRSVLQYPLIVLVSLVTAFVGLITFVIPQFAKVYAKVKVELPFPTRVCLVLSKLFNEQWPVLLLGLAAVVLAVFLILHTAAGRYAWDRLKLRIPLVGPLLLKSALSRFASIFSILQASGVGILDALKILSGTIGNAAISRELEGVQVHLEQGHGVARPLMAAKYFTPMLINMVAVGEEAGNLDEMLREVSLHYDSEVEYATRRLTTAMGPVLIVAMAFLVGFFALAVYMPMWDLAKLATRS
ncbi:MAG: type II secretion system F family protein [Kiritimatiellia bacterium]